MTKQESLKIENQPSLVFQEVLLHFTFPRPSPRRRIMLRPFACLAGAAMVAASPLAQRSPPTYFFTL